MLFSQKTILCLAVAAFAVCGFAAAPANIIRNGSFENVKDGKADNWAVPKGAKFLKGGKDGKQYLEAKGVISTWGLAIQPGKTYKLTYWLKKGGSWLGVTVYGVDSNKKQVKGKSLQTYVKEKHPEWTKMEMIINIPKDFRYGRIIFSTHGGVMSFDGVSLTEVPATAKK